MSTETTTPEIANIVNNVDMESAQIAESVDSSETVSLSDYESEEQANAEPVEATPHTSSTPAEIEAIQIAKTFDLDLDFENYTVAEERAATIRKLLADVKAKTWMASLKDWVDAEGQVYYPYGEQTEMSENPSKRIAWEAGHALETLELINDGVDTEIKIENKRYLCLQKLPKGDEILLSHFNPDYTPKFIALEAELHAHLKVFLKAKTDKQKAFQERFKK